LVIPLCASPLCITFRKVFPSGVMASAILLVVLDVMGLVLLVVAAATRHWVTADSVQVGLFTYCISGIGATCGDSTEVSNMGVPLLKAVQAFVLFVILCYGVTIALPLFAWRNFCVKFDPSKVALAAFVCNVLVCICTYTALILYAAYDNDIFPHTDLKLDWSYTLLGISWLVSIFICVAAYHFWKLDGWGKDQEWTKDSKANQPAQSNQQPPASPSQPEQPASPTNIASPSGTSGTSGTSGNTRFGDWEKMYDENQQSYYYYNHKTGLSQWETPEGVPM